MEVLNNVTADIQLEILTLVEYVQPLFTWMKAQNLPDSYEPDGCVIRYQGDDVESETSSHDKIDRPYQFVLFAERESNCLQKVTAMQKMFKGVHSLKIKDSTRYMRVGSFSASEPFLTEDKVVYAVIGVLPVQVRDAKEQDVEPPKMGGIIINPDDDGFVIGEDCRTVGGNA